MSVQYPETYGWACAWSNGLPHAFIIPQTVRSTRKDAIEAFVKGWAISGGPVMSNWRRAYRDGARCIRVSVSVSPWGSSTRLALQGADHV